MLVLCSDMLGNATTQIHLMQRQDSGKSCWVSVIAHLWNESFQVLSVVILFPSIFLSKHTSIFKIVLIKCDKQWQQQKEGIYAQKGKNNWCYFLPLRERNAFRCRKTLLSYFYGLIRFESTLSISCEYIWVNAWAAAYSRDMYSSCLPMVLFGFL